MTNVIDFDARRKAKEDAKKRHPVSGFFVPRLPANTVVWEDNTYTPSESARILLDGDDQ